MIVVLERLARKVPYIFIEFMTPQEQKITGEVVGKEEQGITGLTSLEGCLGSERKTGPVRS
jgi:hypothetical protein